MIKENKGNLFATRPLKRKEKKEGRKKEIFLSPKETIKEGNLDHWEGIKNTEHKRGLKKRKKWLSFRHQIF